MVVVAECKRDGANTTGDLLIPNLIKVGRMHVTKRGFTPIIDPTHNGQVSRAGLERRKVLRTPERLLKGRHRNVHYYSCEYLSHRLAPVKALVLAPWSCLVGIGPGLLSTLSCRASTSRLSSDCVLLLVLC